MKLKFKVENSTNESKAAGDFRVKVREMISQLRETLPKTLVEAGSPSYTGQDVKLAWPVWTNVL
jgi:hypothetical protein